MHRTLDLILRIAGTRPHSGIIPTLEVKSLRPKCASRQCLGGRIETGRKKETLAIKEKRDGREGGREGRPPL